MKKGIFAIVFLFCLAPVCLFAGEGEQAADSLAAAPSAAVEVGNKICPISGEKVGEHGPAVKIEHMGKIYNLCCGMCQKDFKSDPAKYISKVEEELKAATGAEGAGGTY